GMKNVISLCWACGMVASPSPSSMSDPTINRFALFMPILPWNAAFVHNIWPAMRRPAVVLALLPMLLMVSTAIATVASAESPWFRQVTPGIDHVTFQVQTADAERFYGHAFKIHLDVAGLRLIAGGGARSRRTVGEVVVCS